MHCKPTFVFESSPAFDASRNVKPRPSESSSTHTAITRSISSVVAEINAKLSASCRSRFAVKHLVPSVVGIDACVRGCSGTSFSVHNRVIFSIKRCRMEESMSAPKNIMNTSKDVATPVCYKQGGISKCMV